MENRSWDAEGPDLHKEERLEWDQAWLKVATVMGHGWVPNKVQQDGKAASCISTFHSRFWGRASVSFPSSTPRSLLLPIFPERTHDDVNLTLLHGALSALVSAVTPSRAF